MTMTDYNLPLTYPPKIEAVKKKQCGQTIRKGRRYKAGDRVSFHGWEGKPYRSKWSFRTPYFTLKEVINIIVEQDGIRLYSNINPRAVRPLYEWTHMYCNALARLDYIDPPTGTELKNVLLGMHKTTPFEAQIIRW
jgi:hypothetical protein